MPTTLKNPSSCQLVVREANEHDRDAWNRFVDAEAETPATCVYEWRQILRQAYGVKTVFLIAEGSDGEIRGTLPLYFNRSLRGRRLMHSLRYGLVGDDQAIGVLLDKADDVCRRVGAVVAQVTSGLRPLMPKPGLVQRSSLVMPLPDDVELAWKTLRGKTRNMIRRAQKSELTISYDERHADAVYKIYARSLASRGIPIHTWRFFRMMLRHLDKRVRLLAALDGGEVVAGSVFFPSTRVAQYPIQAARQEALKAAPNQLMIWEMMQQAISDRATMLDLGESAAGSATYRFKENFGAQQSPLYYVKLGPHVVGEAQLGGVNDAPASNAARDVMLQRLSSVSSLSQPIAKMRNRFGRIV